MQNQFSYKPFYKRTLPHIQPEGALLFITFRLANSLPIEIVNRLKAEKTAEMNKLLKITDERERKTRTDYLNLVNFENWDKCLGSSSEAFLSDPRIANLVVESLHFRDKKVYDLIAFSIMPNHVHVVFAPLEEEVGKYYALSDIMHSMKRHTAR